MIDEIDREIIRHLSSNGRASHRELGKAVGLSPNAAGARMARLVERGIITGVHVAIDHSLLGRPLEVSMDVWLEDRPRDEDFLELVASDERVVSAISITGPVDYRLLVRTASPADLEDLLTKMRQVGGVSQTDSRIIMSHLRTMN